MKKYKLRNGSIVVVDKSVWSCGVRFIKAKDGVIYEGRNICLLGDSNKDPLTWRGGAHGKGYDVVGEIKENANPIVEFLRSVFKAATK